MNRIKELINFYSRPLSGKQCDYLLLVDADTALETAEYLKKLYKPYESRKKLPCTCGRKRIGSWYDIDSGEDMLICPNCGKEARGKSEIGVIRAWNKMIMEEKNNR